MAKQTRIGMLTPSSNTVLEPVTSSMMLGLAGVTAHFSRFKVTEIAISDASGRQFQMSEILRAADLLADAKVDVIAWNGTSGSWLGFDYDETLHYKITENTGIPSCTSTLAFRDVFQRSPAQSIGLLTPYTADVQSEIIANWTEQGLKCAAERHCGLTDNFAFAAVSDETLDQMVRDLVSKGCDAIAVVCTNMRAAPLVNCLEQELNCPIYDSVAITLWKCLQVLGIDPFGLEAWGRLFRSNHSVHC